MADGWTALTIQERALLVAVVRTSNRGTSVDLEVAGRVAARIAAEDPGALDPTQVDWWVVADRLERLELVELVYGLAPATAPGHETHEVEADGPGVTATDGGRLAVADLA